MLLNNVVHLCEEVHEVVNFLLPIICVNHCLALAVCRIGNGLLIARCICPTLILRVAGMACLYFCLSCSTDKLGRRVFHRHGLAGFLLIYSCRRLK